MQIQLNGEPVVTEAETLEAFLIHHGYGTRTVATALNGDFVPQGLRAGQPLKDGDRIEIVAPMQGG